MFSLPKGLPVITGEPASRKAVPVVLRRLAEAGFTGYVRYTFSTSLGLLLFHEGKLLSAMLTRGGVRVTGLEALTELCQRTVTDEGTVDAYRLESNLTVALHGLFHGEALVRGQEVRLTDPRALVARLAAQRLTGCVRVYTATRSGLVFYKDGRGFGFFHEGSEKLETTANASQKIANLPGAKLDVFATRPVEQLKAYDILELVNLDKVWEATVRANQARVLELQRQAADTERLRLDRTLSVLEASLKSIASDCIGSLGANLVSKELSDRGGRGCLARPDQVAAMLGNIDKGARLVAGASKVKDLRERLAAEVQRQLAT